MGNGSTRLKRKAQIARPSASKTSMPPIPWQQDLKIRRSAMFEAHKDGDEGPKNGCSVSEGVAFEKSFKAKDEAMIDCQHEMIRLKGHIEPSDVSPNRRAVPDLATKYGRTADFDLGINLYEDNPWSNFVSKLLDVAYKLQVQLSFANEDISSLKNMIQTLETKGKAPEDDLPRTTSQEHLSSDAITNGTCSLRHQVLYKVICNHKAHHHQSGLFVDIPVRQGLELNGKNDIYNFTEYLKDNPDIVFIVLRTFWCDGPLNSPLGLLRARKGRLGDNTSLEPHPESETIYIVSEILRAALIDIADCTPFDGSLDGEMLAPYLFVYHHRKQLQRFAGHGNSEVVSHVSCLLVYTQTHYGAEYDDADVKFAQHMVTAEHLSKLWIPNRIAVSHKGIHDIAYVVASWPQYVTEGTTRSDSLSLECWSWDYDGTDLKRKFQNFTLSLAGQDEMPVTKLELFPLDSASGGLSGRLRDRGNKFWNLRYQHLVGYDGRDFNMEKTYTHTRFMIDTSTYKKMHKSESNYSNTKKDGRLRFDSWPNTITNKQELNDQNLIVMPPNIHGFEFTEKEWISLCVDAISDISWNKDAYNRLVLPNKTKELIQALVTVQVSGNIQDIIAGKGSGLTILLHGGPGTGKTLTAETVAEMAEKPLYRVTCGDIGTNALQVEKYLTSTFYLGRIWGCVLLLDEADVFLEERKLADLQRNSLVSVFLRMLEYYDGILILTSNRVGSFDSAFKSRIRVALHYSKLSRASRKKVWRNFLDMLEEAEEDVDMAELERHLDDLAEDDMNGRQIRNCVTTARQLAVFRNQKLGWQHLEQAIRTAREFESYLKEVHENMTEEEIAREDNLR